MPRRRTCNYCIGGCPIDEDVMVICDVLTSCQPMDKRLTELASRCIINAGNARRALIKFSIMD